MNSRRICLAFFLLALALRSGGIGVPNLHIKDLAAASDLIVVAEVGEVRTVGPAPPMLFHGQPLQATSYSSDLSVVRVIKGMPVGNITVTYCLPRVFVGYDHLRPGTRLVFLREGAGGGYTLANPYYANFPAVPILVGDQPPSTDYTVAVVREMLAVISSGTSSPNEKAQILRNDYALPATDEVVAAFREGVANAQDEDLRQRLEADLLYFNDVAEVPTVANLLLTNTATANQKTRLLYVIGYHVTDRRALPAITPLLQSGDDSVRVAAAKALWHIADAASIPQLSKALQDPSEEVRLYAVRAFSDIVKEPGWGTPSDAAFHDEEQKYLEHWQNWVAKSRTQ